MNSRSPVPQPQELPVDTEPEMHVESESFLEEKELSPGERKCWVQRGIPKGVDPGVSITMGGYFRENPIKIDAFCCGKSVKR